jgi:hypothetical protein
LKQSQCGQGNRERTLPLFRSLSGGGQPQGLPLLTCGVQEELLLAIGTVGYLNLRQHQGVTQEGADFVAQ